MFQMISGNYDHNDFINIFQMVCTKQNPDILLKLGDLGVIIHHAIAMLAYSSGPGPFLELGIRRFGATRYLPLFQWRLHFSDGARVAEFDYLGLFGGSTGFFGGKKVWESLKEPRFTRQEICIWSLQRMPLQQVSEPPGGFAPRILLGHVFTPKLNAKKPPQHNCSIGLKDIGVLEMKGLWFKMTKYLFSVF